MYKSTQKSTRKNDSKLPTKSRKKSTKKTTQKITQKPLKTHQTRSFSMHLDENGLTAKPKKAKDSHELVLQLDDEEKAYIMKNIPQENIRNFSIIAHIDHGKSTLADRLLSYAGNINSEQRAQGQVLDKLEVERARGITIKAQTATIFYRKHGTEKFDLENTYLLNLIDCPGHVDFQYEVSRSLAACQGALILVDSSQGIEAQTLANFYMALEHELTLVPIMTKIDLPHSDPAKVTQEMIQAFGCTEGEILTCSSKAGIGVAEIFPEIIKRIPPPNGKIKIQPGEKHSIHKTMPNLAPFRAMIFDNWYDPHKGVVSLVKVEDGEVTKGDIINTYHKNGGPYEVGEVGILTPDLNFHVTSQTLRTGQVGYIACGIKSPQEIRLGDTMYSILHDQISTVQGGKVVRQIPDIKRMGMAEARKQLAAVKEGLDALPGFEPAKSMVFAGIFPASDIDFAELCDAVEKLTLNDPSVHAVKEQSGALGSGYRCGFLGMLHMDVFVNRLQSEFNVDVITTTPTVPYKIKLNNGDLIDVDSPAQYPLVEQIDEIYEPMVKASIITPPDYVGELTRLCNESRGVMQDVKFLSEDRALMRYSLPLAEVVVDFYQQIKSLSSGYASLDFETAPMQPADVVKLDVKLNGNSVDALSVICHRQKSEELGRRMISKLKDALDRQNFEIIIQCAIGGKILGRERLAPYRKDVLNKSGKLVGGGDITRKKKLLENQKEKKKLMKAVGNVEVSDEAFLSVMKAQSKS
jgi:GTP-binding protein LepA